ncbi:hypothetical protein IDJ75_20340 [Mucilaginibacter rigui]|uniref:TonB C-terminal domain-containing protein n=1 Tax=Mucilaginibacter rigui TaxID=534635 RepID=A0ABR7XAU0_9SPHI|nr:hypothetical protein [Mucilaginibacter rigui]MBD1387646.1 hypothetical protein [Mucilaginibacter rigui]
MKIFSAVLVLCLSHLFFSIDASAQESEEPRNINIKYIQEDSVSITLNESFDMIEDSCSQIIRFTHFNADEKKFYGAFTDVSRLDSNVILTQGLYDKSGLKQGLFISRYVNGNLQAKGRYKNNVFDGKWETYYENGKPHTIFIAVSNSIIVQDSWAITGEKVVDNGTGEYMVSLANDNDGGRAVWKGKLLNGKPEGTWQLVINSNGLVKVINTETFKDGHFVKGIGITGNYKNASRVVMMPPEALPFLQAENMAISSYPCNANTPMFTENIIKHDDNIYLDAHYEANRYDFRSELFSSLFNKTRGNSSPFLGLFDIHLTAEIDELGKFKNIKTAGTADIGMESAVISALHDMPILKPATINGKVVKQKFTLTYLYDKKTKHYSIDYKFLPLNQH